MHTLELTAENLQLDTVHHSLCTHLRRFRHRCWGHCNNRFDCLVKILRSLGRHFDGIDCVDSSDCMVEFGDYAYVVDRMVDFLHRKYKSNDERNVNKMEKNILLP